jgi:hypothetical protein
VTIAGTRSASPTRSTSHSVRVRATTLALVTIADLAFLWMFLATDPLAQLATELGGRQPVLDPALREDALGFAAAWRHGMAGNAWVYLPGFHATAAAIWLHARHASSSRALARRERLAAGAVALVVAWIAAPSSAAMVVAAFRETANIPVTGPLPAPSTRAMFSGTYTLATWSVFVLACRDALVRRTLRPFVFPAILSAGLIVVRPWTVDDFTSHWAAGILAGTASAWASFALLLVLAGLLLAAERSGPDSHLLDGEQQRAFIAATARRATAAERRSAARPARRAHRC